MEYKRIWLKYGNETKIDGSNGIISIFLDSLENSF